MHTARLLTVSHVGGLLHPERLDRPPPPLLDAGTPLPRCRPTPPLPGSGRLPLEATPPPWMQIPSGGCILESHPPFPQWTEGMTHACENITLPQTSFAGINESKHRVHMPSGSQDSLKLKAHAKQSKANFF